MKSTKDESKDEEHIEQVPRLLKMDIRKKNGEKIKMNMMRKVRMIWK